MIGGLVGLFLFGPINAALLIRCRYVIVDFINPFVHFEIDREYGFIYPQS